MAKFTPQQVREKFLNRQKKMIPIDVPLPDLEDLTGELAVLELSAKDVEDVQHWSRGTDNEPREIVALAGMIARSLILRETRERIFKDADIDFIAAQFGMLLLQPLGLKVRDISGLSDEAIEAAKKNLIKTTGSASATS